MENLNEKEQMKVQGGTNDANANSACHRCGSTNVEIKLNQMQTAYDCKCNDCGASWGEPLP